MQATSGAAAFLRGGGNMGELIRNHNWDSSAVGDPDNWPGSLRVALSIALHSGFPIAIYWGEDLTLLYNDAWSTIAGKKHPWALGKTCREVWPEIWETLAAQFHLVLEKGDSIRSADTLLMLHRNGYPEECYFDYTLSPIYDINGKTGGVFNAVIETTYRVINERRSEILRNISSSVYKADSVNEGYRLCAEWLSNAAIDVPFSFLYKSENGTHELKHTTGIDELYCAEVNWEFENIPAGSTYLCETIPPSVLPHINGYWPEPCTEALLAPIHNGSGDITGHLVMGVSPCKKMNRDYRIFLEAVAGYVSTAINNGAAIEKESQLQVMFRQGEENLKFIVEEQRKLVTLVNNSVELMSILELDGKNSYINKAGMEMLGFDDDSQVATTPISDLHEPEDIAFVQNNVLPSVMGKGRWSGRMNVRHLKTREVFPVFNNTVRIDDPETGAPLAIGAVMRDMRPELAAQQALLESERNFRSMIIQAPVAMCIFTGPNHVVEIANDKMIEFWGKTAEAVLNKPVFDALPEVRSQGFEEMLERVYSQGETITAYGVPVTLMRNRKTDNVFVNLMYEPFREANGSISGVMAVASEVTEQILATERIQNSEARFRLLADSMAQFVWTSDPQGNLNYYNQAVFSYSGLDYETLQRDGWLQIVHPDDRAENIKRWSAAIESGEDFIFNHRFRKNDGEYRWQLSRAVPQKDAEGKIQFWIGTSTDIHDHKLFEEQLQAAVKKRTFELEKKNSELEQFAYVSSHDLQEPLRKIRMFTQILVEEEMESLSESSKNYLLKISDSVDRMSTSLKDLLNFSSLDIDSQFDRVDLNQVMTGVCKDLELLIQQKEAVIRYPALPVIRAIPLQMHQLLYNLINNALKFSKAGENPEIHISLHGVTEEEMQELSLSGGRSYFKMTVADNGIGFEQQYASKIFGMFQRLHTRQNYTGTGIGLALCKKVVLNHDGSITASSNPGEGACFSIILPKA